MKVAFSQIDPENRPRLHQPLQHGWKYAMAQQTTVRFIDDLDGSDAVGTVGDLLAGKPLL
jgi:hypothetical protein